MGDDDGCVVCHGPAHGRLHCADHQPTYVLQRQPVQQTEARR